MNTSYLFQLSTTVPLLTWGQDLQRRTFFQAFISKVQKVLRGRAICEGRPKKSHIPSPILSISSFAFSSFLRKSRMSWRASVALFMSWALALAGPARRNLHKASKCGLALNPINMTRHGHGCLVTGRCRNTTQMVRKWPLTQAERKPLEGQAKNCL